MHDMQSIVTNVRRVGQSVRLLRGSSRLHCVGVIRCSLCQITLASCSQIFSTLVISLSLQDWLCEFWPMIRRLDLITSGRLSRLMVNFWLRANSAFYLMTACCFTWTVERSLWTLPDTFDRTAPIANRSWVYPNTEMRWSRRDTETGLMWPEIQGHCSLIAPYASYYQQWTEAEIVKPTFKLENLLPAGPSCICRDGRSRTHGRTARPHICAQTHKISLIIVQK